MDYNWICGQVCHIPPCPSPPNPAPQLIVVSSITDSHTHVAYAGLNACTVVEPKECKDKDKMMNQLYVQSEVLDFDVFPSTEHSGPN